MKKIIFALLTLFSILILSLSSCSKNEALIKKKVDRFIKIEIQENETMDLSNNSKSPEFSKYASSEAKNKAIIIAQSTGVITEINFGIGDKIKTNQTIAKIGNSLPIDINNLQINTSNKSLEIAEKTKENIENISTSSLKTAKIGMDSAYESLKNTRKQYENADLIYDLQHENAKRNLRSAKNTYFDAEDALENFKLNNFDSSKIAEMEAQVKALKNAYKQSKYALEQMEEAKSAQNDQLKFAIEMAENQYKIAEEQYKSTAISLNSQILGSDSQILQLESNKDLLNLNQKYTIIKSPINGFISEIFVEKNSFVGSGQQIAKIEDPSEIILKTTLNESELSLINLYDTVEIVNEDQIISGKINKIAKSLNEATKKADIEISLPKNSSIISGKLLKINFKTKNKNAIYIPINALTLRDNKKIVKTIDEKSFIRYKEIETGEIFGNLIEVKNGLSGNEIILTKGQSFIEESNKVIIKN